MNNEVTARIDISTPTGRKILRELEKHKRTVKIEYPLPPETTEQQWYTHEEVWREVEKKFNDHYGTDYKFKL